jgi:hypothetical protein
MMIPTDVEREVVRLALDPAVGRASSAPRRLRGPDDAPARVPVLRESLDPESVVGETRIELVAKSELRARAAAHGRFSYLAVGAVWQVAADTYDVHVRTHTATGGEGGDPENVAALLLVRVVRTRGGVLERVQARGFHYPEGGHEDAA